MVACRTLVGRPSRRAKDAGGVAGLAYGGDVGVGQLTLRERSTWASETALERGAGRSDSSGGAMGGLAPVLGQLMFLPLSMPLYGLTLLARVARAIPVSPTVSHGQSLPAADRQEERRST